ncbi:MAG: histidinol-phosphatase [Bacteroidaceae bacterium]|nr:histidinol-phosphatase [Bacteroidaceae bacterium]
MKRIAAFAIVAASIVTASAQSIYYQDATNVDMARHTLRNDVLRREIVLPEVNGYKVLKADLHSHTIYSDGNVTPEYRVREAWVDGLDVLAVTEHVEYRPSEGKMYSYLKGYLPENMQNINMSNLVKEVGILTDLNLSNELATKAAESYGITIIPGVEVTRTPETIGHYNALFVKDANTIYDADPAASIRKAREQGAIIMHNHPGWRRKNLQMTEFEQKVYGEGLIDGVEIMNGSEFYPSVVNRASENKLFMAANTDIHSTTAMDYTNQGHYRNMTFILAKDASQESLMDALKKRRTLAYSFGTIAGDEELVKDFFLACVQFETIRVDEKGRRYMRMTNNTSMDFVLNFGGNPVQLRSFTSRNVSVAKGKELTFTVENMWVPTEQKHPEFKLKFKK